jgi:CheY-like chemotaxis protein
MRLDFNVLWVEDQPAAVAAQSTAIANHMEQEGFEFRPTMCRSMAEVHAQIASDVFNDQVDLILVDWDLGQAQGQVVIAEIRDSIRYKEVIFYSAHNSVDALRTLASENGLEGIYCASRADLVDEVNGVFESLVKKVLDLDHTRGIVMGSTSDIDHMVVEIVDALHGKLGEQAQAELVKEAIDIIAKRMEEHQEAFKALQGKGTMAALLKSHAHFTANDRLRVLARVLAQEDFKAHHGSRESVVKYINDVVPKRNDLGHKVLLPDGRTMAIAVIGGEKNISIDEMRELRRLILNLRGEFRALRDALLA